MFGDRIIDFVEHHKNQWVVINNEGLELYNNISSFFESHGYSVDIEDYYENNKYIVFRTGLTDKTFYLNTDCEIRRDDIEVGLRDLCEHSASVDILCLI